MRIRDCVVKRRRGDIWLHHTASSYKVRMNEEALAAARTMLLKGDPGLLSPDERLIHDKLAGRGIVVPDSDPLGSGELAVLEGGPLQSIELELSGACNLACAHCFADLSGATMGPEVLERVFDGVEELRPVAMTLNGGEPMLSPFFRRAVGLARRAGLRVVVMTNATLATPELAGFMKEAGVAKVIASLDSFEEHHDAIRGNGAFARAAAGIRLMAGAGLAVFVTAIVVEESASSAAGFARFCREELGALGVRFSAVIPIGRGAAGDQRLGLRDETLKALWRDGLLSDEAGGGSRGRGPERGFDCGAGAEHCFVAADGAVFACRYFQNLGEPLGNLAGETLAGLHRRALSGSVACRFDRAQLGPCAACPAFSRCRGGCRARARLLAGSFSAPDPFACRLQL